MSKPNELGYTLPAESVDNRVVLDNKIVIKGPTAQIQVQDGPFDLVTGNEYKARVTSAGVSIGNGSIPNYIPTPMSCFTDYLWITSAAGAFTLGLDIRLIRFGDIVFMKLPNFATTSASLAAPLKIFDSLPQVFRPSTDQQFPVITYISPNFHEGVAFIDSRYGTIDIYPIAFGGGLQNYPANTMSGLQGSYVQYRIS